MFIFNKKNNSWYNWIGKFEDERVLVRLSCDSDNQIIWDKLVASARITIIDSSDQVEPFTHLPAPATATMTKFLGTKLTSFLCDLQMRSLHFEELDRNPASRIDGIRLQDLTVRKATMLPIANPENALAQEYIPLGFSEEEV
jgi:hypothetical protein